MKVAADEGVGYACGNEILSLYSGVTQTKKKPGMQVYVRDRSSGKEGGR